MPGQARDTTSRPVISAIAAELFIADIKASCDFFTQKLGFSIVFTYGEPPFYAQVKRDRALLNLKCVDYPVIDPALRDRESLLSADMAVDTHEELKRLFLEFQAAGITFFQTLTQIMRKGEELRDGCGKKRAIHVANRCSNELRRVSALRHSRHEQQYAASLRPSICRAQETHN